MGEKMTTFTRTAQERPEERRERSDRSDEGLSCGRVAATEVSEKARRRTYPAEYKMRILEELDKCQLSGQIGLLLRREGLYSGLLPGWKRWRNQMEGRTVPEGKMPRKDLHNEIARLKRENERLALKLRKAEGLIELQKKISEMMNLGQASESEERP